MPLIETAPGTRVGGILLLDCEKALRKLGRTVEKERSGDGTDREMQGGQFLRKALGGCLALMGLLIFLSPDIGAWIQRTEVKSFVKNYDTNYGRNGDEEIDDTENMENDALYQMILSYNQSIYENGQSALTDMWSYTQFSLDFSELVDDVFGYVEIPALGETYVLYLGASSVNMAKGVAVMGQTSIPIGGLNSNCVIAGHRGYSGDKTFFRYIENIQIGDKVIITNPWEPLVYEAVDFDIISPSDADAIRIREGLDMVTLLTCHPYRSGGQYRYLVYCVRCEEEEAEEEEREEEAEKLEELVELEITDCADNASGCTDTEYIVSSDGTVYASSKTDIEKEDNLRRIGRFVILGVLVIEISRRSFRYIATKRRRET